VERTRIILGCLEGKEIQQVARELRVWVPTVGKEEQSLAGSVRRPPPVSLHTDFSPVG
jgi:hypothetical protein